MKQIPRKRLAVAPMMEWTDRHCRSFHRTLSKEAVLYTEMVTTGALIHGDVARHLDFSRDQHPVVLQLGGSEPTDLAQAAALAQQWSYDEIDLNCGCPSERVQRGAFGACLMAEPILVADCVRAMKKEVDCPVSVKHRLGLDQMDAAHSPADYQFVLDFILAIADAGASQVTIHARNAVLKGLSPKENRSKPPLHYSVAAQLRLDAQKEFPNLKVLLNGGLESNEQIAAHWDDFDGFMVGRAAYDHPLRWASVDHDLFHDDTQPIASASSVVRGLIPYAERWVSGGGRLWAIARHLVQVVEGVSGARHWRRDLGHSAGARDAGPEVFERAAAQLEERGL